MEWLVCGKRFIEADVIRWKEAIWKPKARRKSRPKKIGERLVTAEVLKRETGGWLRLKVNQCVTKNEDAWPWTIAELKPGLLMRRSIETIGKGRPSRLRWTDEAAREAVLGIRSKPTSKFI